jgi:hypothetical protein
VDETSSAISFTLKKKPDMDIRERLPEQSQRDSILAFQVAVKYYCPSSEKH